MSHKAIRFKNAQQFRATGKGYFNKLPNFPATAANANGAFRNLALSDNDPNGKLYLFVVGVQTDWEVGGQYGQAASGRTWFPNNLSQSPITIEGVCANQYEYDRLVEFVKQHQDTALAGWDDDPNVGSGPATRALDFFLKPYKIDTGRRTRKGEKIFRTVYGGMPGIGQIDGGNGIRVQGYVTSIDAGHERFVNAKSWTLDLLVSYDYLDAPVHLQGELYRQLQKGYMQTFNQLYGRNAQGNLLPQGDGFVTQNENSAGFNSDFWSNAVINSHK